MISILTGVLRRFEDDSRFQRFPRFNDGSGIPRWQGEIRPKINQHYSYTVKRDFLKLQFQEKAVMEEMGPYISAMQDILLHIDAFYTENKLKHP